jgi:hypothetical protein
MARFDPRLLPKAFAACPVCRAKGSLETKTVHGSDFYLSCVACNAMWVDLAVSGMRLVSGPEEHLVRKSLADWAALCGAPVDLSVMDVQPETVAAPTSTSKSGILNRRLGPRGVVIALLAFFLPVIGLVFLMNSGGGESQPSPTKLDAGVRFDGTQFTITNNDGFDWVDVAFELNETGLFSDGYLLKYPLIKASSTYTVGALQFAKPDGTRFNPFTTKPTKVSITCKVDSGQDGYWYGGW